MSERKQETIQFICPGCRNTAVLPKESIGTFMPCPSCGVSMAVDADDTPSPPNATDSTTEEVQLVRRVTFRVFRLNMFESWESLFEETAKFANTLPPGALINISHSGGDAIGTCAATVWYWTVEPA